ncbi:hypothetical protein BU24DRAFT_427287 [Aaosphaeria arxii CBS 175.79]|uniref:DUF4484 domain-containing protein n=1 Tax=Aaosphaeria arxii CBS 175.79 TaxID=1450172 RepID=A0A6A5XDV9_9PLEO|nr:uncharacterized protein BU24DRAFT_427287 [Aaosphaeria arxii CBS 175.79]KAF2011079.1 hypothetical protein BU24DRAFT_427287 [Aaosphaeria arxii CBS 175.79]
MSSSSRSSATDVDNNNNNNNNNSENLAPQLSALFLIRFDKKVGYTIAWKRTASDIPLDGEVEFKSLPSGLHGVKSDLVYFVHEGYAGLSAFANGEAGEEDRNAQFVAVGILVPLSYGRLGRSWLHARRLMKIASALAEDPKATAPLEAFWEEQSKPRSESSTLKPEQFKGHSRTRALSRITAVIPSEQSLPPFHPALSIVEYIDIFGPLVFRLQQAALLRKRILFVGAPPVRNTCEFVYNLSVLASIPNSAAELLSPGTESLLRLRSLFSVGIHDIPLLEKLRSASDSEELSEDGLAAHGWVACTTDEIMVHKNQLYDIVVEIPPTYEAAPQRRRWPVVRTSDGTQIKASQRDVWRYKLLHHELWKYRNGSGQANGDAASDDDQAALLGNKVTEASEEDYNEAYDETVVEPMGWSRFAYLGFMWWASAGESDAYTTRERERDRELLGDLSDFQDGLHTAIIAYFHRSTSSLITRLAEVIELVDDEDEDQDSLVLGKDDISRIGLDTWSEGDKAFVQEFLLMYFGRRAEVHGANLECCGVRVPVF